MFGLECKGQALELGKHTHQFFFYDDDSFMCKKLMIKRQARIFSRMAIMKIGHKKTHP